VAAVGSVGWRPFSRLFLIGERAGWVIDEEQRAIGGIARELGIQVPRRWPPGAARRQAVFYGSHFTLFDDPMRLDALGHRIATTYFHGRPGTPDAPEFDSAFGALKQEHSRIARVQVSHRELEEIVLSSGIDPAKVFRIPIGVDDVVLRPVEPAQRAAAREALGLPAGAFVVGSFQKDGVGWDEGLEPKPIKGPDVLVETLVHLRRRVPELHVLLSGPARGFVKDGLERAQVPYVHRVVERYDEIGTLYAALDAYVVPARQEGGPKGVLEAMATGVPLVTTRVGQATDLVRDGENGWLVDVEDVDALVGRLAAVADGSADVDRVRAAGLATASANSYAAQVPLWRAFFDGFVAA
jgi:glycosyltransferase involved in cell wall biosynthesis